MRSEKWRAFLLFVPIFWFCASQARAGVFEITVLDLEGGPVKPKEVVVPQAFALSKPADPIARFEGNSVILNNLPKEGGNLIKDFKLSKFDAKKGERTFTFSISQPTGNFKTILLEAVEEVTPCPARTYGDTPSAAPCF